jgi:DNA modification methylase
MMFHGYGAATKIALDSTVDVNTSRISDHVPEISQAAKRWSGVGPYYAMMPASFALQQVERFTARGDTVLDPFCGRGTIPFAAAALGRSFFGVEIFPVGWVYSAAKCNPASETRLLKRLDELVELRPSSIEDSEFFQTAYAPRTLQFLCTARQYLDWRNHQTDRTLMALILICLHDKKGAGLSNQMRQTKAVHPSYAVRWWKRNRKSTPPDIDPVAVMKAKIEWRYAKGMPAVDSEGKIYLGDCTRILPRASRIANVKLLFTSPPYFGVTNYYADQWLRNWMLGGPPRPRSGDHAYMKRFNSMEAYRVLLERAFAEAAKKLRDDAVIFVRTDARKFALRTTQEILQETFPQKRMEIRRRPLNGHLSQTALFGDKQKKPGEVDLFLR